MLIPAHLIREGGFPFAEGFSLPHERLDIDFVKKSAELTFRSSNLSKLGRESVPLFRGKRNPFEFHSISFVFSFRFFFYRLKTQMPNPSKCLSQPRLADGN